MKQSEVHEIHCYKALESLVRAYPNPVNSCELADEISARRAPARKFDLKEDGYVFNKKMVKDPTGEQGSCLYYLINPWHKGKKYYIPSLQKKHRRSKHPLFTLTGRARE